MSIASSRVGIVGGSFAGCAVAHALQRAGCEVTIFERTRGELRDRGAAVGIPNALRDELVAAGYIGADMPVCPFQERTWIVRDGESDAGRTAWKHPLPLVVNNWGVLWWELRKHVDGKAYREGSNVVEVLDEGDGAVVVLEGGTRERFDLVIGADGYRSKVRPVVQADSRPTYAGYVLFRGNFPEAMLPAPQSTYRTDALQTVVFPGGHAVFSTMPSFKGQFEAGNRYINWTIHTKPPKGMSFEDPTSVPPGLVNAELIAHYRQLVQEHFPPYFARVVLTTETQYLFLQPIYDQTMSSYVSGRVMLAGDAATITRPHTASGGAKALEDALAFERACRAHGTWDAVLQAYDQERSAAGNRLVEIGRRLGRAQVEETPDWASMTTSNDWETWTREMLAGHKLYVNVISKD
ncbi:FAD-dependent monooxygenase [Pendulispora brunnea]|uniref:FAD-dependent monooxygenase n=1 Tax=Pendulispora brunnea TaxID=2905690 RepID=A0ABZ2JWR0_9BACT